MNLPSSCAGCCALVLLAACASNPDRFYTLDTLPDHAAADGTPATHVLLDLTVPSMVDRREMVISTPANGILILDHDRWAAPLSDEVAQTLARDIERRRHDILVGDRGFDRTNSPSIKLKVDIIRMSASRSGQASIEAHWRILDEGAGIDEIGSGSFEARWNGEGYAALAQAYSEALSGLAERLAGSLGTR
jgi:uncharacterized lipoprotein YmbA